MRNEYYKLLNFLLCSFFLFAMPARAQSVLLTDINTSATLAPGSAIIATTSPNNTHYHPIDLTNISGTTKTFGIKRYDILLHSIGNATAQAFFSFAGYNYGSNVMVSPVHVTLSAGQSASSLPGPQHLVTGLDEINPIGYSQVKYTAYNVAQPVDSVQITFNYNPPIGLGVPDANSMTARFNSGSGELEAWLYLSAGAAVQLRVYDASGALKDETEFEGREGTNYVRFSEAGFASGIYLVNANIGGAALLTKVLRH